MIRINPFFHIILTSLFFSTVLSAQNIFFKHLTTENGLSNNKVYDVIQDKNGFIWIATDDGLNRFDGYNVKVYQHKKNDKSSLSNNSVWVLFEDEKGIIWIGTKSGELNRYDPKTDKFAHWEIKSDLIKENSIKAIYQDSKGAIWIGTYKSGLYRFDPVTKKTENWRNDPNNKLSLSNNYVTSILEDNKGNLLVSTYIGLNKFNYGKTKNKFFRFYNEPNNTNSLSNNLIWALSKSKNDPEIIWIGTADGLTKYNSKQERFFRLEIPNPEKIQFGSSVSNVIEEIIDGQQIIWCDSYAGLLRIDQNTGKTERFVANKNNPNKIIHNQINKIIKDRSGVIWIATENGLSYYSSKSSKFNNHFTYNTQKYDLSVLNDKNVTAITKSSDGTIWVGTDEGLFSSINSNGKTMFKKYSGLGDPHIWSLTSENSGNLWIGTYGLGLIYLDVKNGQTKKPKFEDRRLQTNSVLFNKSVYCDDKSNLWIGFWGLGLAKLNTAANEFKLWQNTKNNHEFGISHNDVWCIYPDSKHRIWIGTNGGGVNLLVDEEKGTFLKWIADDDSANSISGNSIYTILESKNSSDKTILWIGTNNGLSKFIVSGSSEANNLYVIIKNYSSAEGLADNSVNSILEDENGNLWVATNSGISFFDTEKTKFTNFSKADGIIGSSFNTASAFISENGIMFFGNSDGLTYFDPELIKLSEYKPNLVITDFKIFNESILPGENSPLDYNITNTKEINLKHNQNVFSFEFAALDFNSPQSMKYTYKMEGFDENWIESGKRRFITYTNLSPGEYTFKVKSTNADGIWQENYKELKIIIASPWWATSYAYAFYILLIIAGLYTIRKFELNRSRLKNILRMREYEASKQKELDEIKSRFFANLSHEFRTPLMLIKGPVEKLIEEQKDSDSVDRLNMIYRNTENLQSLIDQLLDLTQLESAAIPVKASKENLINLLRGMLHSFESLARDREINISIHADDESLEAWVDIDKLQKIINNLLSNSFKFTLGGGSVSVFIKKVLSDEKEYAEVKIKDTGIGIPSSKLDKIFDRFYQVDDSNQRSFGGSGIGLSLVKELVELHRWNIKVESEIDKGTEFILTIPLSEDYLDEDQKIKLSAVADYSDNDPVHDSIGTELSEVIKEGNWDTQKPSILIVEDSPDVRLYLMDLLKKDFTLYEAVNGTLGIKSAKEKIPDLIISDVMMPEMDGLEFCKKIKTDFLTSHIPVIMLTAKATDESRIAGLETGADDYLIKPFNPKELFVRIKNLLDQRKLLREKFSKGVNTETRSVTTSPLDEEFLQRAYKLAEKYLDNLNFDTEAFAKEMFLSRMQLHRKLQAITGQTPGDFMRTLRLKKAAQLLKEKKLSITQIAFAVGYNSPSQFSRAFSKQFNCTPTEYLTQSKI